MRCTICHIQTFSGLDAEAIVQVLLVKSISILAIKNETAACEITYVHSFRKTRQSLENETTKQYVKPWDLSILLGGGI